MGPHRRVRAGMLSADQGRTRFTRGVVAGGNAQGVGHGPVRCPSAWQVRARAPAHCRVLGRSALGSGGQERRGPRARVDATDVLWRRALPAPGCGCVAGGTVPGLPAETGRHRPRGRRSLWRCGRLQRARTGSPAEPLGQRRRSGTPPLALLHPRVGRPCEPPDDDRTPRLRERTRPLRTCPTDHGTTPAGTGGSAIPRRRHNLGQGPGRNCQRHDVASGSANPGREGRHQFAQEGMRHRVAATTSPRRDRRKRPPRRPPHVATPRTLPRARHARGCLELDSGPIPTAFAARSAQSVAP